VNDGGFMMLPTLPNDARDGESTLPCPATTGVPGLQNRRILSSPIRDLEVHGYIIVKEKRNG